MVLDDHIRKGRKLVPPLMAMETAVRGTHWSIERLPELFWLAFLNNRLGQKSAFDIAYQLTQAVQSIITRLRSDETIIRSYIMSEHLSFSSIEKDAIVNECKNEEWYATLCPHLYDLQQIWPDLPLGYLYSKQPIDPSEDLIAEIRELVDKSTYRHDKFSLIIQSIAVAIEISCGYMKFAYGVKIPDLNSISDYPDTEESQNAAGFLVTSCNSLIMNRHGDKPPDFTWQRLFWNSCYTLQPCEYD